MGAFDFYNTIIAESWDNYSKEFVDELSNEMKLYVPHIHEYQKIKEKKASEYFNIFSAISDTYKRENYNSDILKLILDSNTEELGDSVYLNHFLQFIGLQESTIKKYFDDFESVKVLREKHRIDILIHNKKYAVIIESKINETIDQPNQLVRYYRKVIKEDKLKVLKVVYLTLVPSKRPCFYFDSKNKTDGMTETDFQNCVDEIKPKLFCLSAVSDKNSDQGKTLKEFLEKCANIATTDLAKIVISQYAKLLEKTGGNILMSKPEKKLIQEIYSSKDGINNAKDFVKIWENKHNIINEIFAEKFKESHKDWYLEDNRFFKTILTKKLAFFFSPNEREFGFWSDNKFTSNNKKKFMTKLENLSYEGLNVDFQPFQKDWVYVTLTYDDEPIDELFNKVMKVLDELIKTSMDIKEI